MIAVRVQGLSKCYRLYRRPADRLLEILLRRPRHEPFWALRDISFEVLSGETLGVIGDNGAGKSTLLKILAGTLSPTTGEVECRGRVAALLELGAGFHPEFTGRQNIYLNAALLGLSEEEIRAREEEIISFSELEDFIDQPVKTYSSGMYVRLAFAIAVQVDPDVLIVDEALSVGDQHFQRKSLDRILSFREQGKTILFCSHSMYHVTHLCQRALWLDQGRLRMLGPTKEVVRAYEDFSRERSREEEKKEDPRPSNPAYRLRIEGPREVRIRPFDDLTVSFTYEGPPEEHAFCLGFALMRNDEVTIFATSTLYQGREVPGPRGRGRLHLPRLGLLSGHYRLVLVLAEASGNLVLATDTLSLTVAKVDHLFGATFLEHQWEIEA